MGFLAKILGDPNEKILKEIQPIVEEINKLEEKYSKMSDEELRESTNVLRERLGDKRQKKVDKIDVRTKEDKKPEIDELNKGLDEILPDAFAVMREAGKRVLNMRHFDVQLIGGIVLHRGQIAEMKTGEGKTLVATLSLYLNALAGRGAYLITVNDYLSKVGAGWMAPVYHALGMTTGVIVHDSALIYDPEYVDDSQYDDRLKHLKPVSRQEAYRADITYGTNNEFGFDYLRDNMVGKLEQMVQRELNYAIVDEIDSILIDEARTPLIISAPAEESTDKYYKFAQLVRQLEENKDYNVDEKMRAATLSEEGISKMEKLLGVENIYTAGGVREVHHIEQALKAHALFKLDKDYVVQNGEVVIVDEFTGRLMQGRRYSEGLHQAIEAKENVQIQRESQTLATVTFQNYFRMFNKLSGMTGTAVTEAEEFAKIYSLETVIIPTNKPKARNDKNDLIYRSENGKFQAVIQESKIRSEAGQPVLIGTVSIEKNEILANMMEREGLRPQVLNAKNHEKEAKFIAKAGEPGMITIATNMAGRGVDITLGGTEPEKDSPEFKDWEAVKNRVLTAGGLHVIGTERHESRRIDNQLRGRAGRQGDPGTTQFYVSMEDDLMRIFGGDRMKNLMATLKVPEDMPIENRIISKSIESAQTKVEGHNFDIRKHLVDYDDVINKHRESIYRRRREVLEIFDRQAKEKENEENDNKDKSDNPDKKTLDQLIIKMVENEIETVVSFHTAAEEIRDWNLEEIYQVASTIFPVEEKLKADLDEYIKENGKLDKVKVRTQIIEHLEKMANNNYYTMKSKIEELGVNWIDIEKSVLVRSMDTLWVDHLEAMTAVRQGIGLRGYGQRDPLVEYKKEAFRLYNELNNLIQKEVVYSIYKIGMMHDAAQKDIQAPTIADRAKQFSAPSKTMDDQSASFSGFKKADSGSSSNSHKDTADLVKKKVKDEEGNKVGRNDPCPCGSGKKFKKCCGK